MGEDKSHGIWFDRDTGISGQTSGLVGAQWVTGSTGGIYDISITYHALDADTATMFATVNGIHQGFYVDGDPNQFTVAGKSFDSNSLDAMQIFYWSRIPSWKAGDIGLLDIKVTGNLGTKEYADLTWVKSNSGPAADYPAQINVGEFTDVWDLTASDLVLSFKTDFKDVSGNVTTYATLMYEFGLKPDSQGLVANPVGGGWMGGVQVDLTSSPGTWYMNDKFDLQKTGTDDEWTYNVVPTPEPATMLLLGCGLLGLLGLRRKIK